MRRWRVTLSDDLPLPSSTAPPVGGLGDYRVSVLAAELGELTLALGYSKLDVRPRMGRDTAVSPSAPGSRLATTRALAAASASLGAWFSALAATRAESASSRGARVLRRCRLRCRGHRCRELLQDVWPEGLMLHRRLRRGPRRARRMRHSDGGFMRQGLRHDPALNFERAGRKSDLANDVPWWKC